MLNKAYPPWMGGIERHVKDVGEALVKRGWRVTALVCSDGGLESQEELNGVRVIRLRRWGTFLSQPLVTGFSKAIGNLQPDLIHAHLPFPLAWRAVKAVDERVPVVCTWHSDIVRQRFLMPVLSPIEQRFLRRCNRILPTSQPLLDSSKPLLAHRDRCTVIPLAVPDANVDENEIERHVQRIEHEYPGSRVLFVGRLVGYKGLPYLFDAMNGLDATLLVAGDGPMREKLNRHLSSNCKINILGSVSEEEKIALYRSADVFVLPSISRNEAFGYVLLEAMGEGCPVITTDLPTGVRFVNQDGETGLIVPPRDAQALSNAISRLLHDGELRQRFSRNGRERIQAHFRFDRTIDRIEAVYRDVLV